MMLFVIAFACAAIITLLLWRAMKPERAGILSSIPRRSAGGPVGPRTRGPDDDPDFLRRLDEQVRRRDDPPGP